MSRGRVKSIRPGYRVEAADFVEARLLAALTRSQVAQLLHVTVRTVRNWEHKGRVPYSAYELLRIHGGYALPGEAWRGWTLKGGTLWSPERLGFAACDLAYWSLTCAIARQWLQEREQRKAPSPTDKAFSLATSSHEPAAQAGARGPALAALRSGAARVGSEREPDQPEAFELLPVFCLDSAQAAVPARAPGD